MGGSNSYLKGKITSIELTTLCFENDVEQIILQHLNPASTHTKSCCPYKYRGKKLG